MKFIKLESRGGNYLVVAENVAWLRSAENGQTNVGIVGGQPLLVIGSIEEVAAKILGETGEAETLGLAASPESPAAPAPSAAVPAPVVDPAATAPEPQPAPPPAKMATVPEPQPEPALRSEAEAVAVPQPVAEVPVPKPAPTPARPVSARSAALWERPAAPANGVKVNAGSQRMMGALE